MKNIQFIYPILFFFVYSDLMAETKLVLKVKDLEMFKKREQNRIFNYYHTSFADFAVVDMKEVSFQSYINDSNIDYLEIAPTIRLSASMEQIKEPVNLDTMYSEQWGLRNTGINSNGGKAGEDINIEKAWTFSSKNSEIIIAVIDTGTDLNHQDLLANLWINNREKNGMAMHDDDGNGYVDDIYGYDFSLDDTSLPMDALSHGTHCAGTIGASHNGVGTMGVMPNVKIMTLKIFSNNGDADVINAVRAIEYAVNNGAKIISISWGTDYYSQAVRDAIIYAHKMGVLIVASAGNDAIDTDLSEHYPSGYDEPNVIAVGSHNSKGEKSYFSNYGRSSVDIFAPGEEILSTAVGGGYLRMSGTSMATPFVSGGIGLIMSLYPQTKVSSIYNLLIESGVKLILSRETSLGGRFDVSNMIKNISQIK